MKHDERFEMAGQIFKSGIEKIEEESKRAKDIKKNTDRTNWQKHHQGVQKLPVQET